jgi:hypothetical protein
LIDAERFGYVILTKREYRQLILQSIKTVQEIPVVSISEILQAQDLIFKLTSELYKIDGGD